MPPEQHKDAVRHRAIAWYKKLTTRKGRLEHGYFMIEGVRAIRHIAQYQPGAIDQLLYVQTPPPDLQHLPSYGITQHQFSRIANTKNPQNLLAVVGFPSAIYSDRLPDEIGSRILVLEDVQDPGNVGTLIRTATAFGFDGVILSEKCADPLSPKVVQATAGTVLSVWLRRTGRYFDLMRGLQRNGFVCAVADPRGDLSPSVLAQRTPLLLALGNETAGLSSKTQELAALRIKIPMYVHIDSLNVSISGAICMYESTAMRV